MPPPPPHLLDLPDDVLGAVLMCLSGVDLARISQVSTRLRRLAMSPDMWRAACLRAPGFPLKLMDRRGGGVFWRTCYRQFWCRMRASVCPGCLKVVRGGADPTAMSMCAFLRQREDGEWLYVAGRKWGKGWREQET